MNANVHNDITDNVRRYGSRGCAGVWDDLVIDVDEKRRTVRLCQNW